MLTTDLHPYQESAVDRAIERESLLVAYEMGTGKTVIAIAVAEDLLGGGDIDLAAMVVPANLKYQWAQQIAKLTDVETMSKTLTVDGVKSQITVPKPEYCVVVEGSKAQREKQYRFILEHRPDYVVLGYENVVNDWHWVRRIKPGLISLDECTAIKTFKAQRTKKIKRWSAPYRIALTGTPVDNGKPEELFSMMQWVDPDVLGRFDLYDKAYIVRNRFGGVVRYKNLPVLHAKLADVMVRKTRRDPDVAQYLPTTQESTLWADLDPKTRKAYEVIGADLLAELETVKPNAAFDLFAHYHGDQVGQDNSQQGKIMARMQALEMLLNHPDLIIASGMDYEESMRLKEKGVERANWAGSKYCYEVWQSGLLDEVTATPKLDKMMESVETAVGFSPENKIIIFSYYRRMGGFIEEALTARGIKSTQYHGEMSGPEKTASVARFKDDPDTRVIICSHAGAFGTDLYMANWLYNYDLAWSAGTQDQINARHSRASSTFEHIYVVNMLLRNTIEARKPEVLEFKRRTASAILDNRGSDAKGRIDNDILSLTEYLRATLQSAR